MYRDKTTKIIKLRLRLETRFPFIPLFSLVFFYLNYNSVFYSKNPTAALSADDTKT